MNVTIRGTRAKVLQTSISELDGLNSFRFLAFHLLSGKQQPSQIFNEYLLYTRYNSKCFILLNNLLGGFYYPSFQVGKL